MHVFVFHIQPPQPFFAQCMLAASQGYKIARQFITLRLPKGAMQKGQQPKLTARGLDPLIPLPKNEAMVMKFGASAPALIYGIAVLQRQI